MQLYSSRCLDTCKCPGPLPSVDGRSARKQKCWRAWEVSMLQTAWSRYPHWPERGGALQHEGDSARDGGVAPVGPRHRGGGHRHRALPRVVTDIWQQVNTEDWISFLSTCRMGWGCCPWTTWRAWDSSRGWPRWCCRAAPPRRPPRRAPCPAALRQGI